MQIDGTHSITLLEKEFPDHEHVCKKCGACTGHTPALLGKTCQEVMSGAYRTFEHGVLLVGKTHKITAFNNNQTGCLICGACSCHTAPLLSVSCDEVLEKRPNVFLHGALAKQPSGTELTSDQALAKLRAKLNGTETSFTDGAQIRMVALECAVRLQKDHQSIDDLIDRASQFASWIDTAEWDF